MSKAEFIESVKGHGTQLIMFDDLIGRWSVADINDRPFDLLVSFENQDDSGAAYSFTKERRVTSIDDDKLKQEIGKSIGLDIGGDLDYSIIVKIHSRVNTGIHLFTFLNRAKSLNRVRDVIDYDSFVHVKL